MHLLPCLCLVPCCSCLTPPPLAPQALSKYAFGMGSLQVIITTLLFTAVALPAGSGLGTWFLEKVCHAPPSLVSIRTVDEVRAPSTQTHLVLWVLLLRLVSLRKNGTAAMNSDYLISLYDQ